MDEGPTVDGEFFVADGQPAKTFDGSDRAFDDVPPSVEATVELRRPAPSPQANYDLAALIDLDNADDWWDAKTLNTHYVMMSGLHRDRLGCMVDAKITAVGIGYRQRRAEGMRNEIRFDNVAGCQRTPKGGSAKQIVVAIHKGRLRMRWMRPREYARLQGAGDFKFPEGMPTNQGLYGFGDAVCVPAIEWIDRNILTPIYESSCVKTARTASDVKNGRAAITA